MTTHTPINSGDVIYFSLNNTTTFSTEETSQIANIEIPISKETLVQDLNVQKEETEDTQDLCGAETMDFDDGSVDVADKRFSEPYFLRKVLRDELGDDACDQNKLLVIAVHAVLLESGFIGFDSVTGLRVDKFHLPDYDEEGWCTGFGYTLPELLLGNVNESVVLKFQSFGHFVDVYGSLSKGGSSLYQVCLVPIIDLLWANCDKNGKMDDKDVSVFELWKTVKDGLALPLLIDLCDKTGLNLPACFMRLPTELKVKILESLPGVDVAKMGCVCSEMRYLSSNDDLWKQKFAEGFRAGTTVPLMTHWKDMFAYSWRKRVITPWQNIRDREPYGTPLSLQLCLEAPHLKPYVAPIYFPSRRDPEPSICCPGYGAPIYYPSRRDPEPSICCPGYGAPIYYPSRRDPEPSICFPGYGVPIYHPSRRDPEPPICCPGYGAPIYNPSRRDPEPPICCPGYGAPINYYSSRRDPKSFGAAFY